MKREESGKDVEVKSWERAKKMWTEIVRRKTTRRLSRQDISQEQPVHLLKAPLKVGWLSTCHVRRLFGQSAITVSRVEKPAKP